MLRNFTITLIISISILGCKSNSEKSTSTQTANTEASHLNTSASFSEQLDDSPRHHEWITLESNGRELYTFVAYPESAQATKAVIVIHENRGLNDWARYFTDQLAAKGYLALAPDLLSNAKEGIQRTTDYEDSDAAREGIYGLNPEHVTNDLNTVFKYARTIVAGTGEVAVVGFCWGGSQTFRYATNNQEITSANVFYGTAPDDPEALTRIQVPVFGYYGGDDNRVNATIPKTDSIMKAAGLTYEYEIYEGAGHAFMRRGAETDTDQANKNAHDKAWKRLLEKLKTD